MKLKKVLVPVDFSPLALAALDYAVELCRDAAPEFIVLLVQERVQFAELGEVYGTPVVVRGLTEEERRAAESRLHHLVRRVGERGVRARHLVLEGVAHQVIVDTAKRQRADLIVMGTHGRRGVTRILLGSVAELVMRHAHCPVLTVREPRASARRRRATRRSS
jgi:nucleotide-binding universal stress UspA family protein